MGMRQSLGTPNLYYIVYGRPLLFAKSHTYDARKNVRLLKDNIRITDAARKNIRVLMDNIRRLQKIYVCCKMIYIYALSWDTARKYMDAAKKHAAAARKNIELLPENMWMPREKYRAAAR